MLFFLLPQTNKKPQTSLTQKVIQNSLIVSWIVLLWPLWIGIQKNLIDMLKKSQFRGVILWMWGILVIPYPIFFTYIFTFMNIQEWYKIKNVCLGRTKRVLIVIYIYKI